MKSLFQVLLALVAALSAASLSASALAQTGQNASSQQPAGALAAQTAPDYIVYRVFFSHVAEREQMAAQLEAQGKNAEDLRAHDWQAAGLTADEGSSMKQIALNCIQALSDQSEHMRAELAAQGVQPSNSASASNQPLQQYEHRSGIVNDHITQLKQALSDESFAKLDKYVRGLLRATSPNSLAPLPTQLPVPVPNAPVNPNIPAKPSNTSTTGANGGLQ